MRRLPSVLLLAVLLALAGAAPAAADHEEPPPAEAPVAAVEWEPEDAPAGGDFAEEGIPATVEVPAVELVPGELAPAPAPAPPAAPAVPLLPRTKATVSGRRALLRTDGRAAIPRGAPQRVRKVIAAANRIVGKPYKWGGGHGRLFDSGYDCSGAVSYALVRAGLLGGVMVSGGLARVHRAGAGRWITIYANAGHVYLEVAGLRLDTSPTGDPRGNHGVRWRPVIGRRGGFAARHPAGL